MRVLRLVVILLAAILFFIPSVTPATPDPPALGPAVTLLIDEHFSPNPLTERKIPKTSASPTPSPVPRSTAKPVVKPKPRPRTVTPRPSASKTYLKVITISTYVDAPWSQAAIDACNLVLWDRAPLWLAGHNWCGFQWMAYVPTGTTVRVTRGRAAGTFVVTGHYRIKQQSGPMPNLHSDLVLQTCIKTDTAFTMLRRVS